jgi:hypothetical protein
MLNVENGDVAGGVSMHDKHKLLEDLKFARDEARLRIHLASKEA